MRTISESLKSEMLKRKGVTRMTTRRARKNLIKRNAKEIIAEIKACKKEGHNCLNITSNKAAPEISIELLRKGYKIWWYKGFISISW